VARIVGSPVAQGEEAEKLQEVVAKVTQPHSAVAPNRTFKHQAERFLAFVRGSVKPLSYRNLGKFVGYLIEGKCPGLTPGMDVSSIDPEAVERVFLFLREGNLDNQTRKTRWAWFKRLIRYFWESEMMELPRNLDSPALKFKVAVKAIKTWSAEEVRACLGTLPPRMQLWALLGLNCGMTNVDIGSLRKDQVNLKTGRLVRKRVKTETHELVPTVDYRLWPETLKLLKEHWSKHPELGLTSSDGTSLYTSWFEGKNTRKKDLLALAWRRAKVSIPLKAFRSISATLLESHAAYGRYKSHFLGHSPKGIADKHYAAPSGELFDTILVWLHDQIFKK
jgi:integrase